MLSLKREETFFMQFAQFGENSVPHFLGNVSMSNCLLKLLL